MMPPGGRRKRDLAQVFHNAPKTPKMRPRCQESQAIGDGRLHDDGAFKKSGSKLEPTERIKDGIHPEPGLTARRDA